MKYRFDTLVNLPGIKQLVDISVEGCIITFLAMYFCLNSSLTFSSAPDALRKHFTQAEVFRQVLDGLLKL